VIQPIATLAALARQHGALFHTDAAQAAARIGLDVNLLGVDLMSLSAHKMYGPKGVGALYVRRRPRARLLPLFSGGGQERGLRAGTLPAPLLVGFGVAARIAAAELAEDALRIGALRDALHRALAAEIPGLRLNGSAVARIPGNLNLSFPGVEAQALMMGIKGLAVSSGSACTSASLEPSYVLRALGVEEELAHTSLRIGFGRFTTEAEVDFAADRIVEAVQKLSAMSPLWEMAQEGIDIKSIKWAAH